MPGMIDPPARSTTDEFTPATPRELARYVVANARGTKRPLFPVGGRTALRYGGPLSRQGVTISTSGLTRIIDYPARDMTITVEAGLRIQDLQDTLRRERQRLPLDIPQSHRATLGGAIATNASGPGRFAHGTFRDYVIGISAVDGRGRLYSAGGRVVKNVAGYDLCKLLVGSLGTLGIITQVTLKLRPLPDACAFVWGTFAGFADIEQVLARLLTSAARPVAIEVLNAKSAGQLQAELPQRLPADSPVLCVACEGTAAETAWQAATLQAELATAGPRHVHLLSGDMANRLWAALTEYQSASDDPLTFKATLPPSRVIDFLTHATAADVAIQAHAGNGVVIGHLPDHCSTVTAAEQLLRPLRDRARASGGNLVILSCDDAWKASLPVFGHAEPSWPLMQRIKSALDPFNVLNPGLAPFAAPPSKNLP